MDKLTPKQLRFCEEYVANAVWYINLFESLVVDFLKSPRKRFLLCGD